MADTRLRDDVWEFVPFVPRLKAGFFGVENADAISKQLRAIVEDYQSRGWEFVRLEQVEVLHTAGCLASLFGKSSIPVSYDLIVFRARRGTVKQSSTGKSSERAVLQGDEDDWDDGERVQFSPALQDEYDDLLALYNTSLDPDSEDEDGFFTGLAASDAYGELITRLELFVNKLAPKAGVSARHALLSRLERDMPELRHHRRFQAATAVLRAADDE